MFNSPLKRLSRFGALFALAWGSAVASAQGFPNKPIVLINPYAPGGFADNVARIVAQEAGKVLGQAIVLENRSGASGKIGLDAVLNAPKDGYTLGLGVPGSLSLFPVTDPKYADLHARFSPITMAVRGYLALAINPAVVPSRNIRDFAGWLRPTRARRPLVRPVRAPVITSGLKPSICPPACHPCMFPTKVRRPHSPTCWVGRSSTSW